MASAQSSHMLDNFTSTIHSSPPPDLSPKNVKLSTPFVICIIGASRGIGEHIAYSFAYAGASTIVLSSRSSKPLQGVADQVRSVNPDCHVEVVECDVSSPYSVGRLAGNIETSLGRLDALIMNSGYSGDVILDVTKTPLSSVRTAVEVNYLGTFYAAHHFIPLLMKSEKGARAFIVIGSIAGAVVSGPIANAQYCVSKTAQAKLTEHVHEQYGKEGLLAVSVHPGAVLTQMARESKGAEGFLPYCTDAPDLCGAFCVWLAKETGRAEWLGGRLASATWDVRELEERRKEIVEKDLLKFYCHV